MIPSIKAVEELPNCRPAHGSHRYLEPRVQPPLGTPSQRLAIARAYFHDASVLVLAQARSGPGRPSTGVLEALQLGGAHTSTWARAATIPSY